MARSRSICSGPRGRAWASGCGRASGVGTAASPTRLATTRASGGGAASGDCARIARWATPASSLGSWPACASRGRRLASSSPPPWLLAWARKSAWAWVSGLVVRVRMTSRVGITGAASSSAKPMPSTSMPCTSSDSTRVALRRSRSPMPADAVIVLTAGAGSVGASGVGAGRALDGVEQQAGDVEAELRVEFADAGGAGDVDLGQPVADHVQADEAHAAPDHLRTDLGRDPAVALAERAALAAAAGGQVAAELVALRDARQAVVDRHAVDQQDALVAFADLRQVALRHRQVAAAVGQGFKDHVEVGLAGRGAEDRAPAHAVQRLQHGLAMFGDEVLERGGLTADQGRRAALREQQGGELLVQVAQAAWIVDHVGAGQAGGIEDLGVVDVVGIDRRIRAHQHHVAGAEVAV